MLEVPGKCIKKIMEVLFMKMKLHVTPVTDNACIPFLPLLVLWLDASLHREHQDFC